ncbi:MAG: trypsin-like peptidase domain-containing protein [Polaromonas sp.]|nr:trypsin-like peptidase domain-containing protein [Gemmatimonadaceae bacterium]
MTIDLRVLSGARAGARENFDAPVVTVGRHPMSDFRFDPLVDLDVSTRHAEFRNAGGMWIIADLASTNGTFVNGERITGERRLGEGDVVSFGGNGPRVEVRGVGIVTPATSIQAQAASSTPPPAPAPRMDTQARVAVAVKAQTKDMRRAYSIGGSVLVAAAVIAFAFWQRETSTREREMASIIAHSDSTLAVLAKKLDAPRPGETAFTAALKDSLAARKRDLDVMRGRVAAGTATSGSVFELSKRLERTVGLQQALGQMDVPKVVDANDAAVAMVASDFVGKFIAGTAFGITPGGLLVTNRHVVRDEGGKAAGRVVVIYANTRKWLPAHIVRVADGDDDDLALIQLDGAGSYPVVAGVSRTGALARVGAAVVSIGYPGATDTPMEGSGMNITASTTSTLGTVSKRLSTVIQIDSYAGHGSSGSPLFDSAGHVVGVIYGGARESAGRIVYAVPAQRLASFIGGDGAGVIK